MAVAGLAAYDDVEITSIGENNTRTCDKPVDFPYSGYWLTGAYLDNRPVVCGGLIDEYRCDSYSFVAKQWKKEATLSTVREGMQAIVIGEKSLWITGGRATGNFTATTEILEDGQLTEGIDLPYRTAFHCLVRLDDTRLFLAGGFSEDPDKYEKRAFILDLETDTWTLVGEMKYDRYAHSCGVIQNPLRVVVVGGFSHTNSRIDYTRTTEIFEVDAESWSEGPSTPDGNVMVGSQAVQYKDTFLQVGGRITGETYRIYQFDSANLDWVRRKERLSKSRSYHAAFQIPASQC